MPRTAVTVRILKERLRPLINGRLGLTLNAMLPISNRVLLSSLLASSILKIVWSLMVTTSSPELRITRAAEFLAAWI